MAASATAMKFSGVGLLATSTPRREAAAMSILSVPMNGTMTRRSCGAASITPALIVSRCEARTTWARARPRPARPPCRRAPRHVEGPADRDRVTGRAERVELLGGPLGPVARIFSRLLADHVEERLALLFAHMQRAPGRAGRRPDPRPARRDPRGPADHLVVGRGSRSVSGMASARRPPVVREGVHGALHRVPGAVVEDHDRTGRCRRATTKCTAVGAPKM